MEIPVYKTKGVILKKTDLNDTGRLLAVFTEKFGKILVRAKGIGKKESKLKSLIEPFNIYEFSLAKSKTMDVLAGSYPVKEFVYLHRDLENLSLAIYFSELADKLIFAPERDDKIWRLLTRAFEALDQKRSDLPKLKTAFEDRLLSYLGHPSSAARGKFAEREKQHYLSSLAGEEIKSGKFLSVFNL